MGFRKERRETKGLGYSWLPENSPYTPPPKKKQKPAPSAAFFTPLSPDLPVSCSPGSPQGWRTHRPSAALPEIRYSWWQREGTLRRKGPGPAPEVPTALRSKCLRSPSNRPASLVTKQEAPAPGGGTSDGAILSLLTAQGSGASYSLQGSQGLRGAGIPSPPRAARRAPPGAPGDGGGGACSHRRNPGTRVPLNENKHPGSLCMWWWWLPSVDGISSRGLAFWSRILSLKSLRSVVIFVWLNVMVFLTFAPAPQ